MRLAALVWFLLSAVRAADAPARVNAAGASNAPITIEVFSDFQCPACKTLHDQVLRPLMREYVESGKVYLIHRDFPLPGHAYAREATSYVFAAARLGKYQQAADTLFLKQALWSANGKVDDALSGAFPADEFRKIRALAKDPSVAKEVQGNLDMANAAGIRQTPTMVVTRGFRRYPLTGGLDYNLLRQLLNDLLAK